MLSMQSRFYDQIHSPYARRLQIKFHINRLGGYWEKQVFNFDTSMTFSQG